MKDRWDKHYVAIVTMTVQVKVKITKREVEAISGASIPEEKSGELKKRLMERAKVNQCNGRILSEEVLLSVETGDFFYQEGN